MKISIIVAKANNNAIGKNNQLIWKLSSDLKLFKKITSGHYIIMGRKTYESVGKPLPNRTSIVITRNPEFQLPDGHIVCHSLQEAIQLCIGKHLNQVFIIGGAEIYKQGLELSDELLVTEVNASPEADVFFPPIDPSKWKKVSSESYRKDDKNEFDFDFVTYKRIKK
ncbi:Dihydrofolate reductase [Indibacter alkaliphilus LW1]|uniref:Dihydrofolate reductase n=1 Tax=Indibacter alkaliphilus (strain CCUG 57479 / KCTC 22604 / LW1) TaxID=1189612 RepID=S2D9N8_INDAL|nr:dihydrofolate reductase [Indibacter alkaliphilus]EOZ95569.1 Dihydrofolate reductase [Indibacter alkaliphilus LW1]